MDPSSKIFLALLCVAWSSAETLPWFYSREALPEVEKPCGSLIRPREGGQQPEVFRFRLDESPSVSFWKRANEVEGSVRGECAVAIEAPKSSSRLAVGVDLAAVEGLGEGQCLSGNHIALYDLQGGRLILKDTICGWQKAAALMDSTSNMALVTINLRGVKKGSFILKVSVLREGEYPSTTEGNYWVPPATATPEKYQEHTEVFLVPDTSENSVSSEEQSTESTNGTTIAVEGTTLENTTSETTTSEITTSETTTSETTTSETTTNDDKDITEEGYDPVSETTTKKEKMSTTKKPGSKETDSPDKSEEMETDIEGSGFGSGRTTEKPSGGPGGSGIEFVFSSGTGNRRTTTELPGKPEGSGIEFLIPSASGEGRSTPRPGGSGIVFIYPSGHGIGRTTADYHAQSNGDYVSIPWAEASEGQSGPHIPNQSITDSHPKEPHDEGGSKGTTPLNNLKETESLNKTDNGGSDTTLFLGESGNSNEDLLSDGNNTYGASSGTALASTEASSVAKTPRGPGIEFVYPGRPAFALVSDNPSLLPDFPLFPETTTARPKLTTRPQQDSGIVFVFHEELSTEQTGESVRSLTETESSKGTGIARRILKQTSSTLPPREWPMLSAKWRKRISTPSTDSSSSIDTDTSEGLRKEADSTSGVSTAMTPAYSTGNHSKIVESVTAAILKTEIGGRAGSNPLGKKKRPLGKKGAQNGLRNVITTKSHKRDPWSGIQLVIPKKVVTSSQNPITSSFAVTNLTSSSISIKTVDRSSHRSRKASKTPPLSTTDRIQPEDHTIPIDASATKSGKVLDDLRIQTKIYV